MLLNLTNSAGEFFPLNDGPKGNVITIRGGIGYPILLILFGSTEMLLYCLLQKSKDGYSLIVQE
jgi:hypothetical protein